MTISTPQVMIFWGSVLVIFALLGSTDAWTGRVCSKAVKRFRYERYCYYRTWRGCCGYRSRRISYFVTQRFCCSGYEETSPGNQNCNKPICRPYCFNGGTCVAPDRCDCPDGRTGRLCEETACASYLKPCYPGWCLGNTCKCSNAFGATDCSEVKSVDFKPIIDSCQTSFSFFKRSQNMQIYEHKVDATGKSQTEIIWSNQKNYNILNMTFEMSFDFESAEQRLPMKPNYIGDLTIGVVSAMVDTEYSRLPLPGTTVREDVSEGRQTYTCQGLSASNPVTNTELKCRLNEESFQLAIFSGDWFTFTFSAKIGGYRELINTNNNQYHNTDYYTGDINTVKTMQFRFDFDDPYHCSNCPSQPDLKMEEDITKLPITARWSGWEDDLSGVAEYTLEVFKLQPQQYTEIMLEEPDPLRPVDIFRMNHTNPSAVLTKTYTPSEPGVYSLILEVRDVANNSVYVRRFALYDPVSTITVSNSHKLFVSSAQAGTGYTWQSWYGNSTDLGTNITINWKDYFLNKLHEDNYFLNAIRPYPPQLDDGGRRGAGYKKILSQFEDNEGERQTAKIPNSRGIVRYEIVSDYDNSGGTSLADPPNNWRSVNGIKDGDSEYFSQGALQDGSTAKVWVRAHDAMGNTKTESTLVHFDMSDPVVIDEPSIQINIENGTFPFSSRINVGSKDEHSGVYNIHWKLRMENNRSFVKMQGDALNPVQSNDCIRDCYRTNIGERYNYSVEFDINHCWMRIPKENLDTQVMELQMEIINSALLSVFRVLTINNIRSYSGIEDYFGPMNIRMTRKSDTGVSLSWDHAPSCYARDTILVVVVMPDNSTKTLRADKDADRFDVTGLVAMTRYPIQLYTVYIIDDEAGETINSRVSNFVITTAKTPKPGGLSSGEIVGIVIGVLLVIAIVIAIVVLVLTGRLAVLIGRMTSRTEREPAPSVEFGQDIFRENGQQSRGFHNKAYSRSFKEDMIYYGEMDLTSKSWTLSRKDISLEQQIKSGRFATIFKAKMFSSQHSDSDTVVVKALKSNYSEADLTLMRAKISFYGTEVGNHPNILKFIGAVDDVGMGPFMVLEYCENGTMKDYLTSKKNNVDEQVHERLFKFAFDVCKGMEYLANKKIVHRRLAARNILLTFLYEVKISGFGPVPDEESDNEKGEKIPVKWLPPECIEIRTTRDATEKSDVWSYGIVLWEIFTIGETPFPDVRSANLLSHLRNGERPPAPEYADPKMYGLMKKCWHGKPEKRPSFTKSRAELEKLFVTSDGDEFYYDSKFIYDNNT